MILLLDMLITLNCISRGFLFNSLLNLASLRHINFQLEFRPNILSQLKEGHNKFSTGFIDFTSNETLYCFNCFPSRICAVPPPSLSLSLSLSMMPFFCNLLCLSYVFFFHLLPLICNMKIVSCMFNSKVN